MKRLKIYLDTSVINFIFAEDAPEKREITLDFFEEYVKHNVYEVYVSPIVIDEINKTRDEQKRQKLLNVINDHALVVIDFSDYIAEIQKLSMKYIEEAVIPEKKLEDALHIAICTVFSIDALVSWNYKHMANINKERLISAANIKNGYSNVLRLVTPLEVMFDE